MSSIESSQHSVLGEAPAMAKRPFYAPGWYRDIPNEEYHKSFGYSSSQLKVLTHQTPAHLLHGFTEQNEPSSNMVLGTAVHKLILEPDTFKQDFVVAPKFDGRTNAGKIARTNFDLANQGKTYLSEDDFTKAADMAAAVLEHPVARLLVTDCITESSIYWWYKSMDPDDDERYATMVKVRPDVIPRSYPILVDLKTTADGSYSGFQKSIQNFNYHVSAAMYLEGVNQCRPLLDELGRLAFNKFVFVCVENFAPYCVSVYEMSPEYLDIGKAIYRRAMRELNSAKANNWPGYEEGVRVIEPPTWANRSFVV